MRFIIRMGSSTMPCGRGVVDSLCMLRRRGVTGCGRTWSGLCSLSVPSVVEAFERFEFGSWNQIEGVGVARTNNAEMAPVEGGDFGECKALGDDDQAGIRAAETEVGIRLNQVGDPSSVSGRDRLDLQLARGESTEERCFRGCAELPTDEVGAFGDHKRGRYKRARALNDFDAGLMIGIGVVGGREENARVDDEQALVSAEAVGQKLVGIAGEATGGG